MPELNCRSVPSPSEIEWTRILDLWKQSGLGGPTFCRREGLSPPRFYSWKRKLRLREEANTATPRPRRRGLQFATVEVKPIPTSAPLELALGGESGRARSRWLRRQGAHSIPVGP